MWRLTSESQRGGQDMGLEAELGLGTWSSPVESQPFSVLVCVPPRFTLAAGSRGCCSLLLLFGH